MSLLKQSRRIHTPSHGALPFSDCPCAFSTWEKIGVRCRKLGSSYTVRSDTPSLLLLFVPGSREKEPLGAQSIGNQQHRFSHKQAAKSFKGLLLKTGTICSKATEKVFPLVNN
jgi:hypothetical protein